MFQCDAQHATKFDCSRDLSRIDRTALLWQHTQTCRFHPLLQCNSILAIGNGLFSFVEDSFLTVQLLRPFLVLVEDPISFRTLKPCLGINVFNQVGDISLLLSISYVFQQIVARLVRGRQVQA